MKKRQDDENKNLKFKLVTHLTAMTVINKNNNVSHFENMRSAVIFKIRLTVFAIDIRCTQQNLNNRPQNNSNAYGFPLSTIQMTYSRT